MKKTELQRIYNCKIYPRGNEIYSDKAIINIDGGSQGGTPWTCLKKDNKPNYFINFGGQPDKSLLNQLPKPIKYHHYKIQDIYSKLCGSYCLYFFNLIERSKYYDSILKMYFD